VVSVVADAGIGAIEMLVAAFAGGALGAAIGALPAFSLAGLLTVVGEVARIADSPTAIGGSADVAGYGSTDALTSVVALGPGLGPHVAFAGGVAATAYAARKGYIETDYRYHEAKHVTMALGSRPDVLAVGGVFGVLGYLLTQLSAGAGLPVDPVFLSIVVSAVVHRLVLGYPLIGRLDAEVFDMSPFETGERRIAPDGGASDPPAGGRRLAVEPWLPHQYRWANVAVLGAVAGLFGAFVTRQTGSWLLAFGVAAAALAFLAVGAQWVPVTHHMVLPASIIAFAMPDAAPAIALVAGGVFGLVGGVLGEGAQRVFYAHADTHFDPAALSIVLTSILIGALDVAGVFVQTVIPTGIIGP